MSFNGPGISLFQGDDLSTFDSNAQREEEEEAIEDQKRRDIELKSILENAFNDVSFENEECSELNLSFNQSDTNHQNKSQNESKEVITHNSYSSIPDFEKPCLKECVQEFPTPLSHTRNVRTKMVDFNSHRSESYPDECRIRQQNGSLHDVVDASGGGGGGDIGAPLNYNQSIITNLLGDHSFQTPSSPTHNENVSLNKLYQNAEYNSIEQLQVLYEVRVREVHRLTELIDTTKNNYEIEKGQFQRQLALAAAEIERHKISQNELQNLLISSKEEIDNLKKENESFKTGMNSLEESKKGLLTEIDMSRVKINDLERKLLALEKGRKDTNAFMQYEANIQEMKERHAIQLQNVVQELDKCKMNLEAKSTENEELKYKIIQLSQINDENLAKKSEVILRLSQQIEETQERYEKLIRNSLSEDSVKMQMEIKILKDENSALMSKVENLEKSLANHETELKQYECLNSFSVFETNDATAFSADKENEYSEINKKLREELFRSLKSQKARRQEIQTLQTLLKKKEDQIQDMTEKEREFLTEAAKFREDIGNHLNELRKYECLTNVKESEIKKLQDLLETSRREFEDLLKDAQSKCREIENENKSLREELEALKNNVEKEKLETVSKYNEEYMKFHNEGLQRIRGETEDSFKLQLLSRDMELENLKKEVEEIKNLYVEVYNEKENLLNQIEKDKLNSSRGGVDVDEVKKLQKELEKSRQRILDLDRTLRQQYQQEVEKLNGDIRCLNLEIEKLRKEKDHEISEKNNIIKENELWKNEVEQITAEKNFYFLNCETLKKDMDQLKSNVEILQENSNRQLCKVTEECSRQAQDIKNKYEIQIQKLNKEIELTLMKQASTESKYTSPMKALPKSIRDIGTQGSPISVQSVSTSPLYKTSTQESCTSPIREFKKDVRISPFRGSNRDISVLTDPEPKNLTKREVVRMMERLGAEHEEEVNALENKYRSELQKLDKKWLSEVELIKEKIRVEMMSVHAKELEELKRQHRIELTNRVEQEKKEVVVSLITEWACEVQTLKQAQSETQVEVEKMKKKYKAAKNLALRYKTYFTSKAEVMRDEWKKVEDSYQKALKDLEKSVHVLVDVREDEVKAKIESITKLYEYKINKMKNKLQKYEDLLRNEEKGNDCDQVSGDERKTKVAEANGKQQPDRLVMPSSHLCRNKIKRGETLSGEGSGKEDPRTRFPSRVKDRKTSKQHELKCPLDDSLFSGS